MSTTEDHGRRGRMTARREQGAPGQGIEELEPDRRHSRRWTIAAYLADGGYQMLNLVGAGGGR